MHACMHECMGCVCVCMPVVYVYVYVCRSKNNLQEFALSCIVNLGHLAWWQVPFLAETFS